LLSLALAVVTSHVLTAAASAATVTYILDLSTPGAFTLYADVSDGDNQGLAFFSVPLVGTVTNLNIVAPLTIHGANFSPAGFYAVRTPTAGTDPVAGPIVNPYVSGSQDVISGPAANLITGFGQEAGNWEAKGITPFFFPDATTDTAWGATTVVGSFGSYDHPLRLATGNYTGALDFDRDSLNLAANTWSNVANRDAPAATVALDRCDFHCGSPGLTVDDLNLGDINRGSTVTATLPGGIAGPEWTLESFIGPSGPVAGASVDFNTGQFTWNSSGAPLGPYSAVIRDSHFEAGTDTGTLSFNLVPEPASIWLVGLALIGYTCIRSRP
jgi:hypothetical protein